MSPLRSSVPVEAAGPVSLETESEPAVGTLGARATSGMVWSLTQRWSSQVLASVVFVVLARLVAPKAFGLIAIAGVFVAFANVFLGSGFAQAVIVQRPLRKDHVDTAFWTNTGLGGLLAVIGVGIAPLYAHLEGNSEVSPVLMALSLDFLIGALGGIPEALLTRELEFRRLSIRTFVSNVIADVLGVVLAFSGAGVWALVVQTLSQTAIDTAILWVVSPRKPGMHVTKVAFDDMRDFGLNNIGLNGFNLLNRQSDNFLIGTYLGATKLGFYAVAYQILNLFEDAFVNTTQVVMFPIFAAVSGDRKRLERSFEMASRATAILAIPAFVGLALVSRQMIPLLFGHKWNSAVPVAQVLSFIGIVHALTQFNGQVCKAVGKAGIVLRFSVLNTGANVIGFFVAVHYGIFWVAVAYVARGWLLYPLSILMVKIAVGLDVGYHVRGFVAPVLATTVMAGAVGLFEHESHDWSAIPRLIVTVLVGTVVYVAVIAPLAGRQLLALLTTLRSARQGGPKRAQGARAAAARAARAAAEEHQELSSPIPGLSGGVDYVSEAAEIQASGGFDAPAVDRPDPSAPGVVEGVTPLDRLARRRAGDDHS